ncbi:MAG: hemolysin III family protein [Oligoflexia bacterium]|nr:hemolysin III family protein [Oligoflexia bacterium]
MLRLKTDPKDIVSGTTHLVGAFLSVFAIYYLTLIANSTGSFKHWASFLTFGISMLLLYLSSTIYHLVPESHKTSLIFKRVDHMMIYVFIAGSSTPISLIAVGGKLGFGIFLGIWICAALGCLQKIFWIHAPRWFSTLLYVLMGWAFGFVTVPLIKQLSMQGFLWLLSGGVAYTVGALIYAFKWPDFSNKWFGFHELFHLFVMLGSFCHFWTIIFYLK